MLSTNGTIYDQRIFEVLAEQPECHTVVVTFDAFKEAQDKNRPFRGRRGIILRYGYCQSAEDDERRNNPTPSVARSLIPTTILARRKNFTAWGLNVLKSGS